MLKSLFVDVLKKRIKEKGYNQENFAEKIGIGYSTLKKYLSLKNDAMPDVYTLSRICDTLDCDIDYILGRMSFTTQEAQQVFNATGLNEPAYTYLKNLKENKEVDADIRLSTLNQILISKEFDEILHYLTNARIAYTGLPIKYNQSYLSQLAIEDRATINKIIADNDDYMDSREYHAAKSLGNLFDKIVQIPMEDYLMIFDYMDYYFDMFGEHFPLSEFTSDEIAAIQIKQCLLTCTPYSSRKDGE